MKKNNRRMNLHTLQFESATLNDKDAQEDKQDDDKGTVEGEDDDDGAPA